MLKERLIMAEAAKGTLFIAVRNVLQYLVLFLFYVMAARILSPVDIGKISILMFFMTVFTVFTEFSLPVASAKFISESIAKGEGAVAGAVAEKAFRLVLLFSVPSMLLASFLSPWLSTVLFGTDAEAVSLIVVAVTCVVLNIANLYSGDLRGLGKFGKMALAGLSYVAFSRILSVTLAWFGYGVQGVVVGWFLGAVIYLFLSRFFLGGELPHSGGGGFGVKVLLAYCYPVLAYTVVAMIQGWVDVMILYALTSDLALEGVYYLAVSGSMMGSVFWVAIATTMLPLISAKYGRGRDVGGDIAISTRLLNLSVLPFSFGLAAASQTAVVLAYGPDYLSGVLPFAVLMSASIIQAYVSLFSTVLQAVGETRALMNVGLISSILDVIVVVVLARWLGVMGAVVARVVMFSVALSLCYWEVKKRLRFSVDLDSFKKALLLSIVVAVPIAFVDSALVHVIRMHPFVILLVDGAIFVGVGSLVAKKLKLFKVEDVELLRHALPKRLRGLLSLVGRLIL